MRGERLFSKVWARACFTLACAAVLAALPASRHESARAEDKGWTSSAQAVPVQPQAIPARAVAAPAAPGAPVPAAAPVQTASAAQAAAAAAAAAQKAFKKSNARELFAAAKGPADLTTRSIGFYAKGCLAGGKPLPVNGPAWQVMRTSRNRNWGHPSLIQYIERFATDAKEKDGWPGLLVGDLSMPRGGPMPYGHASHQDGLDVDIWYKPAPSHELSSEERESMKMQSFLIDPGHVDPEVWKPDYEKLLRRAVAYPEVARIFVNPAIKKWLCDNTKGDRAFLSKVTAIGGHDDHFHVRLNCPPGQAGCQNQDLKADEGCGKGLDQWIAGLVKPKKGGSKFAALRAKIDAWRQRLAGAGPGPKKPPMPVGELPPECETVLKAGPVKVPGVPLAQ
jgi:penicillin-insensitive murein DD-endopeptidase